MSKAVKFSNTFRYIVNNASFRKSIREFFPSELELKETAFNSTEVCYLDTRIGHGDDSAPFHISVYDKREDFDFRIVNFPFMDCSIPANPAYGVYVSQFKSYLKN